MIAKFRFNYKVCFLVTLALVIKVFLATISPRSFDFINYVYMGSFKEFKLLSLTPYFFSGYLMNLFYRFWLLLPIRHPPVSELVQHEFFAGTPEAFLFIAIMKLPMLIFDGLTCLIVYKMVKVCASRSEALLAVWLWLFNPYLTMAIETGGTTDIVSAFFVVSSLYLFIKRRFVLSGILLAIGFAARFWPLVLIPFYIMTLIKEQKAFVNLIKFVSSFITALIIFILPFFFTQLSFSALRILFDFPIIYNQFSWFLGFNISGLDKVKMGPVSLIYFAQAFLTFKFWKKDLKTVWDGSFLILLAYVAYSYWNPYYPIWVTPLVIVDYVLNKDRYEKINYTLLFALFWIGLSLFSFSLIFIPSLFNIYPYSGWPLNLDKILKDFGDQETSSFLISTFGRSILAGAAIIYFIKVNSRNINIFLKNK